jgi:iron complex outermembrane receptor protein
MLKAVLFIIILNFFLINAAFSSESEGEDSLKTYRLGEITTTALRDVKQVNPSMKAEIEYYELRKQDANSAAEFARVIPAAQVQTNSRGETLLFIRGAQERQLGLYFDGVLLNVPWDNRMDLSMLPADITGKITVEQGTGTVLYGPNVLGGAVNISSFERSSDGFGTIAKLQFGDASSKHFSLTGDGRIKNLNYVTNVSYMKNDGFLLSSDAPNPLFHQNNDSRIRTNTDQERLSVYGRIEYDFSAKTKIGFSYHFINGEKGVAAETHRPDDKARFWRYPNWTRNLISLNGEHVFSKRSSLKATFWFDNFYQKIDEFQDFSYNTITGESEDFDNTIGTRLSYSIITAENHNLIFVYNGLFTDHTTELKDHLLDPNDVIEPRDYTQYLHNFGAQYSIAFNGLSVIGGVGYDTRSTPKTGIFTEQENSHSSDYTAMIGAQYQLNEELSLFANSSRKTRFPTLREQFDDALGKFIVNPDLKPETGILSEVGIRFNNRDYSLTLAGFLNYYEDLIIQTSENGFKKRVNSENFVRKGGVELIASVYPLRGLDITGHLTYIRTCSQTVIEYSPEFIGAMIASYKFDWGFSAQAEAEFISEQIADNPTTDRFETLDGSTRFNLRLAYAFQNSGIIVPELFFRVNNLADTFYWDKLGLPAAGRTFYVGTKVVI